MNLRDWVSGVSVGGAQFTFLKHITSKNDIAHEIRRLSVPERLNIITDIWDEINDLEGHPQVLKIWQDGRSPEEGLPFEMHGSRLKARENVLQETNNWPD